MAGFLGFFDYSKPGPGIPKNAPPKARLIVFFEIFFRKFWNLVKINMLFSIFNIPSVFAMFLALMFFFPNIINNQTSGFIEKIVFGIAILCIPLITVGPAQSGFTYILRNYAREEHAFIWSDFKEHALKNLRQSLIVCLIDFIIVVLIGFTINFYMSFDRSNTLMAFASGIVILAFIVFLMMHLYIYPIMVTFKLKLRQIYKNAFLFSLIKFIPNFLILLLCFVIIYASFYFYVIGFMLLPFITFSFIGLITNFYSYGKLKKYMIDKVDNESSIEIRNPN